MEQPKHDGMAYLDLLINTLMEHEKNLDEQISRLETIVLDIIKPSSTQPKSTSQRRKSKEKKLSGKFKNGIKRYLDILSGIILTSGLFDLWLWFKDGALIPSWTMTAVAIFSTALIQVVRKRV